MRFMKSGALTKKLNMVKVLQFYFMALLEPEKQWQQVFYLAIWGVNSIK